MQTAKEQQVEQLSPELINFFNSSFDESIAETIKDGKRQITDVLYVQPDGLSIIQHLEDNLDQTERKNELNGTDRSIFNSFLPSLRDMVEHRKLTMGFTSFVETLTDLIRYIIIWLNLEKGYNIDAEITSRRKSLIGELKKILVKAYKNVKNNPKLCTPPVIRDRFGLRIILTENNPHLVLEVAQIIVTILTNRDSDYYIEFTNWLAACNDKFSGEEIPRNVLLNFLELYQLEMVDGTVKDFINFPKDSTYQSWHITLMVKLTSAMFGGFMFELQARTWAMHENAEIGPASHDEYKKLIEALVGSVFEIKDYSGGIVLYAGPDHPKLDLDGISQAKHILSRHVSPHVAERMVTPSTPPSE